MRKHEAKVATLPRHRFIGADETVGRAGDSALTGLGSALFMKVDVEGQKKAALWRRCDLCCDLDELHLQLHGVVGDEFLGAFDEGFEGYAAFVAFGADADGDAVGGGFFVA